MKITFKLFASLQEYLPERVERHEALIELPEGLSAIQVLERHDIPLAQVHLVLVNGVFIPPSQRDAPLSDGDELAVWPAIAGG